MTAWSSGMKRKMLRFGGSVFHGKVSSRTFGACPRSHIAFNGGKTRSLPGKPELKEETLRLSAAATSSKNDGMKPARILLLPKIRTRSTWWSTGKIGPWDSHFNLASKTTSAPFFIYGKLRYKEKNPPQRTTKRESVQTRHDSQRVWVIGSGLADGGREFRISTSKTPPNRDLTRRGNHLGNCVLASHDLLCNQALRGIS